MQVNRDIVLTAGERLMFRTSSTGSTRLGMIEKKSKAPSRHTYMGAVGRGLSIGSKNISAVDVANLLRIFASSMADTFETSLGVDHDLADLLVTFHIANCVLNFRHGEVAVDDERKLAVFEAFADHFDPGLDGLRVRVECAHGVCA